jgi:hypothetical protein
MAQLCFALDKSSMFKIAVKNPKKRAEEEHVQLTVKPLELIWRKYSQWDKSNR